MYDMKALYQAHSRGGRRRPCGWSHPEAQIIAGGSDVLVQDAGGQAWPVRSSISIYGLRRARAASRMDEDGNIGIGSLTSFSHIDPRTPSSRSTSTCWARRWTMVGGPQIRNIGTIGGNTCNGVTSADSASTLHAWDGHRGADRQKRRAPPAHPGFLHQGGQGGHPCRGRRDPDRHPDPEGQL